jgi:DNA-binding response OmpR family regulator
MIWIEKLWDCPRDPEPPRRFAAASIRVMRPDALILDINMPGMSGYAVVRALRERYTIAAPLMIGISGVWTKTVEQLLGRAVGFDHYLIKPYEPQALLALLEPLRAKPARRSGGD